MMIGLSRTEHDGNPRVGGFERRNHARSGETWGNMSRIRQGGGRRKRKDTRDRHGKRGCINREGNREAEIRR